jgi:hypothetical protein
VAIGGFLSQEELLVDSYSGIYVEILVKSLLMMMSFDINIVGYG